LKGGFCLATKAQIEGMLERMEKVKPKKAFQCVDETQAGIGAVLRLLEESSETVTAGRISEKLDVSTARVAVLLKKMAAKGLITRERGDVDARITVVRLTELGAETIVKIQGELYRQVGHMIDVVGEERLIEFITIAGEIQNAVLPPEVDF